MERNTVKDHVRPNLSLCYKMMIEPVNDLLNEPEIVIVPNRSLHKVPFPFVPVKRRKYLSETHPPSYLL